MSSPLNGVAGLISNVSGLLARIPTSLVQIVLRFGVAVPFFKSGLTKWDSFLPPQLSDTTLYLFQEEFKLHIFGSEIAYPAPHLMALLSSLGEIILPVLLVLGLGTRYAALGILGMTAIIQLTVPDGWPIHITWAAMTLAIVKYGPGRLSLDKLLCRIYRTSR